jgi:hypothetical protein
MIIAMCMYVPYQTHDITKKNKLRVFSPQASYTDRPRDLRLLAKLVPTLADRGYRVVSATKSHGR